jgi:hypothetical protein
MGVDHRRHHVAMAQQFMDGSSTVMTQWQSLAAHFSISFGHLGATTTATAPFFTKPETSKPMFASRRLVSGRLRPLGSCCGERQFAQLTPCIGFDVSTAEQRLRYADTTLASSRSLIWGRNQHVGRCSNSNPRAPERV